jgi:hypothetical protein
MVRLGEGQAPSSAGVPAPSPGCDSQYEWKTNQLWPVFLEVPEFAFTVALRARPDLGFTGTVGGAATTLRLAFALALRLATLVGSTVATSIVSTLTDFAATISMTLTLPGSGAITSIVSVTTSIAAALAGGAAMGFSRSPNPMFFANADRRAVELGAAMGRLKEDSTSLDIAPASCRASPSAVAGI